MSISQKLGDRVPEWGMTLLEALQFHGGDCQRLTGLNEDDWHRLLALSDSSQTTLLLGHYGGTYLPDRIRSRIEKNVLDNADRFRRITQAVAEISTLFDSHSVDFCVLKGFTHSPELTPHPLLRAQGDIDLWCLPAHIDVARDALLELGYRPFGKSKGRHLDPMIRPTEWQWRGDYFARDLPIPVDLHFTLWDEKLEFLAGPDELALWQRRVCRTFQGQTIKQLDPADTLLFAVLHFMMHLLHGDPRLQRAWEIGYFLDSRSADVDFWKRWEGLYSPEFLNVQCIAFDLARQWFGCELPAAVEARVRALRRMCVVGSINMAFRRSADYSPRTKMKFG